MLKRIETTTKWRGFEEEDEERRRKKGSCFGGNAMNEMGRDEETMCEEQGCQDYDQFYVLLELLQE